MFPQPFIFADALHWHAYIPIQAAAETAYVQLVAPTRIVLGDDSRDLLAGRRFALPGDVTRASRRFCLGGLFGGAAALVVTFLTVFFVAGIFFPFLINKVLLPH